MLGIKDKRKKEPRRNATLTDWKKETTVVIRDSMYMNKSNRRKAMMFFFAVIRSICTNK